MKLFEKFKSKPKTEDTFATLIQAAQEDPEFRKKLLSILQMDAKNRTSSINSMIHEMTIKKAPSDFIAAIKMFTNDEVAEKALEMLKKK